DRGPRPDSGGGDRGGDHGPRPDSGGGDRGGGSRGGGRRW
ncbi:MAG: 30S ribosomal protein S3, partial [Chloroflexi bacterium]|nr:30S ribosomal protein S3 [Chloroflexota bacterium]